MPLQVVKRLLYLHHMFDQVVTEHRKLVNNQREMQYIINIYGGSKLKVRMKASESPSFLKHVKVKIL